MDMDKEIKANAQTGAESSEYYDDFWASYERDPNKRIVPGSFDEARINFITQNLGFSKANKQLKILDLGCGDGWISNILANFGDVTGTDFAPKALDSAKEKYGNRIHFHLANTDYEHLGLGENTKFDVVVSSEVIEHVHNHLAFILQINQFLLDGGICIITTPNGNVWNTYKNDIKHKKFHQPIEDWLSPSELQNIVKSSGFSIKSHTGWTNSNYPYNPPSKYLGKPKIIKLFDVLRIKKLWGQLILPYGILQLLCARKVDSNLR